jgi:hypothetical protein
MRSLHKTESPLYIAPIRFVDGANPETHKDALIEDLYGTYQHLTQFVFEFPTLLLMRLTQTDGRVDPSFRFSRHALWKATRVSRRDHD